MKKVIRLTEGDIQRIVRRVIKEQSSNGFITDIENVSGDDYEIIEWFVDWAMQFDSVEDLEYEIKMLSKNPEPWFKKVVGAASRTKDDEKLRRKQLKQISRRYGRQQAFEKNKRGLGVIGALTWDILMGWLAIKIVVNHHSTKKKNN